MTDRDFHLRDAGPIDAATVAALLTGLHASGPVAYIAALVVTASARRRGIGKGFVDFAKEWGRSHGCSRLTVTSAEHRDDAHAFYPSMGMPYTGRRFSVSLESKPAERISET